MSIQIVVDSDGTFYDALDAQGRSLTYTFVECPKHSDTESPGWFAGEEISDKIMQQCHKCGKTEDLKLCGRCKNIRYCSQDCQLADRAAHKAECDLLMLEAERPQFEVTESSNIAHRSGYRHRHAGYRRHYRGWGWPLPFLYPPYAYWYRRPYREERPAQVEQESAEKWRIDPDNESPYEVNHRLKLLRAYHRNEIGRGREIVPDFEEKRFKWVVPV